MTEPVLSHVDFAAILRRHRMRAALTQRELSVSAGLGPTAVRDFEQRRSLHPRVRSVRALAAALDLPPDEADALQRAARADGSARPAKPGNEESPGGTAPLSVSVLGPLLVSRGAAPIDPGARRHRVVLARLALAPDSAVDPHELIELLWGEQPPASSVSLLQGTVSQLRRVLQRRHAENIVRLLPGGYRLNVAADLIDATAFRTLTERARRVANGGLADALLGEALDLWRGEPAADVPELQGAPVVRALVEDRIAATLHYADVAASAGRWNDVLRRLDGPAARYPLHEPLHAQLAVALAATGRQADALHVLRRIRERLGDELGIDPGPEIMGAQRTVLRQEWRHLATVPASLPAAPDGFVGRMREVARAVQLLGRPAGQPAVVILSGPIGVGKSALLTQLAVTVRADFPDGVLYLDLGPPGRAPLTAEEALTGAVRALGADARGTPAQRAAQYRQLVAHRRLLALFDNVREAGQVRSLLPDAVGSAVVISSRRRLVELPGATAVPLGPLAPEESRRLMATIVGPAWAAVSPFAATRLTAAGGHLPLALKATAGRLAGRTAATIGPLVARLADPDVLLDALSDDEELIAAHLLPDLLRLPPEAALGFRMLALVPGPTFGPDAAAATLGVQRHTAAE
ncbi:BTAD domain-containing putative transcriptional regulator, partial [Plantactinospora siamensis]